MAVILNTSPFCQCGACDKAAFQGGGAFIVQRKQSLNEANQNIPITQLIVEVQGHFNLNFFQGFANLIGLISTTVPIVLEYLDPVCLRSCFFFL